MRLSMQCELGGARARSEEGAWCLIPFSQEKGCVLTAHALDLALDPSLMPLLQNRVAQRQWRRWSRWPSLQGGDRWRKVEEYNDFGLTPSLGPLVPNSHSD